MFSKIVVLFALFCVFNVVYTEDLPCQSDQCQTTLDELINSVRDVLLEQKKAELKNLCSNDEKVETVYAMIYKLLGYGDKSTESDDLATIFASLFENGRNENAQVSNEDFRAAVKTIIESTTDLNEIAQLKSNDVQKIRSQLVKKFPSEETEINELSNDFENYLEAETNDDKIAFYRALLNCSQ